MIGQPAFLMLLLLWLFCAAVVLWEQRTVGRGTGLIISYVLQLWVLHWLAAALDALPWYGSASLVATAGLQQSTIAIAGFALGSSLLLRLPRRHRQLVAAAPGHATIVDARLVRRYLAVGILGFVVFQPVFRNVPTVGALTAAMSSLVLLAVSMECWNGLLARGPGRRSFWRWVALSAALPFVTIVTQGFLGYGFAAMFTIFAFVASFYRPRWKLVVASAFIGYFALSLYVTYMRDRQDIRRVVWGQESYATRLATVARTFGDFEFFDIGNYDHLARVDDRLNQNVLVGMAVLHLKSRPHEFADGRTIWEAVLSPIPRTLWPDKPIWAGSGNLVSEFTGVRFAEGTSVGIGHVMEWYVNFGSYGVFFGMAILGVIVGWLDQRAAERLYEGDWTGFALWWVPGLSLLQVGGSLVDAVSGACAALVVVTLMHRRRPPATRTFAGPARLRNATSASAGG